MTAPALTLAETHQELEDNEGTIRRCLELLLGDLAPEQRTHYEAALAVALRWKRYHQRRLAVLHERTGR